MKDEPNSRQLVTQNRDLLGLMAKTENKTHTRR